MTELEEEIIPRVVQQLRARGTELGVGERVKKEGKVRLQATGKAMAMAPQTLAPSPHSQVSPAVAPLAPRSHGHGRGSAPALLALCCCSSPPPAPSPLTLLRRRRRRCSQSSPRLALCGNGSRSRVARLRHFHARQTYHVPRSPSRRPSLAI
jgi:hypothetical protein